MNTRCGIERGVKKTGSGEYWMWYREGCHQDRVW